MTKSKLIDRQSLMTIEDYESIFRRLDANQYFTNHGPLAQEFESTLETFLKIDHVVAIGNESLALLIALASLELQGEVVVPAWGGDLIAQVAKWLRLGVRFSDVDPQSHQASIATLRQVVDAQTSAVCLVETYGNKCDPEVVDWLCQQNIHVVVLAVDSLGSETDAGHVLCDPAVVTIFGFGPNAIVSTTQGGAIATANTETAERCRNIRSSYGTRRPMDVVATCNGRFSEFQAGVGLVNFGYLPQTMDRNHAIAHIYDAALASVPGVHRFPTANTNASNGQCYPIIIDPRVRPSLHDRLSEIHVALPEGIPSCPDHLSADKIASQVSFLPVNNDAASGLADQIAEQLLRIR